MSFDGCYCSVRTRSVIFPRPDGMGHSSMPADLWHRLGGVESIPGALDARERVLAAAELEFIRAEKARARLT